MAKVQFKRTPNINTVPIADGQLVYDTNTGDQYFDYQDKRLKSSGDRIEDNIINNKSAWSSKQIIDTLCPPFTATGSTVTCNPVLGYPLTVKSQIEPKQGTPNTIVLQNSVTLTQESGEGAKTYTAQLATPIAGGMLDWEKGLVSEVIYQSEIRNPKIIVSANPEVTRFQFPISKEKAANFVGILGFNPISSGQSYAGRITGYYRSDITIYLTPTISEKITEDNKAEYLPVYVLYKDPAQPDITAEVSAVPVAVSGENTFSSDTGDTTVSGREYPYSKIARQQSEIDALKKAIISTGGNV